MKQSYRRTQYGQMISLVTRVFSLPTVSKKMQLHIIQTLKIKTEGEKEILLTYYWIVFVGTEVNMLFSLQIL